MKPLAFRFAMTSSNPSPQFAPGPGRAATNLQRDRLFVAWIRARQQQAHRRNALLHGIQAQPDPSEAAGIAGPITAWAEGHARDKRRHANSIAQLRRA